MLAEIGIERIELSATEREAFRQKLLPIYSHMAPASAIRQMEQYLAKIRNAP
jgi:hypothetical protein